MIRPELGSNAVRDIHLDLIEVLGDIMDTLKSKRSEDKKVRHLEMLQQAKSQEDVSSVFSSQVKWTTIFGIFESACKFGSAGSNLLDSKFITGMFDGGSKTSEIASNILSTSKQGERYKPQNEADKARMAYDDYTRKMEEALQSGQSIEQFLTNYIDAQKEKARTIANLNTR